jgi:hypothetical protein
LRRHSGRCYSYFHSRSERSATACCRRNVSSFIAAMTTEHDHAGSAPAAEPAAGRKVVNLALQGGGSHGAFTWGVLDRLLQEAGLNSKASPELAPAPSMPSFWSTAWRPAGARGPERRCGLIGKRCPRCQRAVRWRHHSSTRRIRPTASSIRSDSFSWSR